MIEKKKDRNLALDITRIIAVLSVVLLHVSINYVSTYDSSSAVFVWANILNSISRAGVPLFVMVSGSLMLDENKVISIKTLFSKKIKTIVCLLFFWSVVYCGIYRIAFPILRGEAINIYNVVDSLVLGHDHLWYLYMTVGLYLATPFLRSFVRKENKQMVLLFIWISIAAQFTLPVLNGLSLIWEDASYCIKFIEKFNMGFFGGYVAYYLIGWYIVHIGVKCKWWIYLFGFLSLVEIVLYAQMTNDFGNAYVPMNIFVLAYSFAIFTVLNSKFKPSVNNKTNDFVVCLSNLSFGVYAVHLICQTFAGGIVRNFTSNSITEMVCIFVFTALLSFAVSFIASKLPIIKKTVKM